MPAMSRRPDTVVATAAQSRARTPGTSSTGPETTKTQLVLFVLRFYGRQPNGVMSSAVSFPSHTFTGQA